MAEDLIAALVVMVVSPPPKFVPEIPAPVAVIGLEADCVIANCFADVMVTPAPAVPVTGALVVMVVAPLP